MCQICGGAYGFELVQIEVDGKKVNACIPCATERKAYCPWGHGWLNSTPCECYDQNQKAAFQAASEILGGQESVLQLAEHITEQVDALCLRAGHLKIGTANPNKRLGEALLAASSIRKMPVTQYVQLLISPAEVDDLLLAAGRK